MSLPSIIPSASSFAAALSTGGLIAAPRPIAEKVELHFRSFSADDAEVESLRPLLDSWKKEALAVIERLGSDESTQQTSDELRFYSAQMAAEVQSTLAWEFGLFSKSQCNRVLLAERIDSSGETTLRTIQVIALAHILFLPVGYSTFNRIIKLSYVARAPDLTLSECTDSDRASSSAKTAPFHQLLLKELMQPDAKITYRESPFLRDSQLYRDLGFEPVPGAVSEETVTTLLTYPPIR